MNKSSAAEPRKTKLANAFAVGLLGLTVSFGKFSM